MTSAAPSAAYSRQRWREKHEALNCGCLLVMCLSVSMDFHAGCQQDLDDSDDDDERHV
jgi:hypothetical protein